MTATDAKVQPDPITAQASGGNEKLRYAVKTSLSLTLAYLIPMALGWPQPQTAATTVMLIAATGLASDSLQKGVMRVFGTVAGAIIGLSLIALFPQDRMTYLLCVSLVVAVIVYLYNAWQGDSTVFMLTAVVTLMVFNGGDADGAFIYGIDRAFMTVFGVAIYTLVASMLWPVKLADNTRHFAATLTSHYHDAFHRLDQPLTGQTKTQELDDFLAALITEESEFQTAFNTVRNHAEGVTNYLPEWLAIVGCLEELRNTLIPALKQRAAQPVEYERYIIEYRQCMRQIDKLFADAELAWRNPQAAPGRSSVEINPDRDALAEADHLVIAAVAGRIEQLQRLQALLLELRAAQDSLLRDEQGFVAGRTPAKKPAFIWVDLENLKTAARAFIAFWISATLWILFNPPGGFVFVTLCTILIPLVSFTPVTPRVLIFLLTLGFFFALPAYVFLLPNMHHWLHLAVFLFCYAFIGFYVFSGPVSIFFLLGLFTLGLQNEMHYNMDALLLVMLMFYMVCATLIIVLYWPFSGKPEHLYDSLRPRFFRACARQLRQIQGQRGFVARLRQRAGESAAVLLAKMEHWGPQAEAVLPENARGRVLQLNRDCEIFHGQLQALSRSAASFTGNPLIDMARSRTPERPLALLCEHLAGLNTAPTFERVRQRLGNAEQQLDELLRNVSPADYNQDQLAEFYIYLNLQASLLASLDNCRKAQERVDWRQLQQARF